MWIFKYYVNQFAQDRGDYEYFVHFLATIELKYRSLRKRIYLLLLSMKNGDEKGKVLTVWKKYANKYHTTQTLISTFNLDFDVTDLRETFIHWKWQGKVSAIPLDAEEIYYKRVNSPLHPWYYIKTGRKFLRRPSASGCAKLLAIGVALFGLLLNDQVISLIKTVYSAVFNS